MHICIYCKKEKKDSEFNREHVIPRMMGRYINAPVLSDNQVCQECNTFFSKEIENKISLDSYEAFLRMKSGTKKMSDGRRISSGRITLVVAEGIFNGLKFTPVSDAANPERMHFDIMPCIGLQKSENEFDYYSMEELPIATDEKIEGLKKFSNPIIQFGYDPEEVKGVLIEKGYITEKAVYSERSIGEEYSGSDFMTSIKFSIDSYVRRVCAKTIFNYLCWTNSVAYILDPKFDSLRQYIRDGVWDNNLWFRYSIGFVSAATPPNKTSHVVGTMIYGNNEKKVWELL